MEKEQIASLLESAASVWGKEIISRRFLIVFGNLPFRSIEVVIQKGNFLHLTGVLNKQTLNANQFFDRCLNRSLSLDDFNISKKTFM
jgi:hypothetical protein